MTWRMRVLQRVVVRITCAAGRREPNVVSSRKAVACMERAFRLAPGVTVTESLIAGVSVRRFTSGGRTPGTVLHLHGGAYYCGSSLMGRRFSRVTADGGPDMVSIDYRLAPEHPYPAAVDDVYAVYVALAAAGPVVVMGESAGGGLALALVQRLRDEGRSVPVALAPLFPWADLTQSSASYAMTAGRDLVSKEGGDWAAGLYAAGQDLRQPGISPLFGSFDGFPPTLLTVGTADSLLDETRAVAKALRAAGAHVTVRETRGGVHGFTTLPCPEAHTALDLVAEFVREHLTKA
jgi:monoterpene epsilon-lactone hydrolase